MNSLINYYKFIVNNIKIDYGIFKMVFETIFLIKGLFTMKNS